MNKHRAISVPTLPALVGKRLLLHGNGDDVFISALFHPLNDQAGQVQHRTEQHGLGDTSFNV